jgi:hypothetical protein
MFVEAVVTRDELLALIVGALPLAIHLDGDGGSHTLALDALAELTFVPDVGVRFVCSGHLHWPVLGIDAPITLSSLRVLLTPEINPSPSGETLVFGLALEHVDIAGVPGILDDAISQSVNDRLAADRGELAWDFSTTLAQVVPLAGVLDPPHALTLGAAWGKVKITADALVLAISVHTALVRHDDASAPPRSARHQPTPTDDRQALTRPAPRAALSKANVALFGFAAGAAFFALRSLSAPRW